jgi:hypothetical protein
MGDHGVTVPQIFCPDARGPTMKADTHNPKRVPMTHHPQRVRQLEHYLGLLQALAPREGLGALTGGINQRLSSAYTWSHAPGDVPAPPPQSTRTPARSGGHPLPRIESPPQRLAVGNADPNRGRQCCACRAPREMERLGLPRLHQRREDTPPLYWEKEDQAVGLLLGSKSL